jgi:predicted DCC family thiol-disulfide oxidoreductase YuxK
MNVASTQNHVILFDGVCNLCNGVVQFIIKRDKKKLFHFASLQSDFGQQILQQYHLPPTDFNSFILLENSKLFTKSTGALRVARSLSSPWSLLYTLIVVPSFIRNWGYNLIARNRYKWFGKQNSCWVPTPELMARFIA